MIDIDQLQAHADDLIVELCDRYCIHSLAANQSCRPHLKKLESMETECDRCPIDKLMKLIYPEED